MNNKRSAAELNNQEQTTEGSQSTLQQEDNAKRAKLTTSSLTTLHHLPTELLQRILARAIVMEVKDMKLVKRVWKEKADLVIDRLRPVCSQWNRALTTNNLRNEVHRTLDETAQKTICMEILQGSSIPFYVHKVSALGDDIFALCKQGSQYIIKAYDRNNLAKVKDIYLPETHAVDFAACDVSNYLYVLAANMEFDCPSIYRIRKDAENKFHASVWIRILKLPLSRMSVSVSGHLVLHSKGGGHIPSVLRILDERGSLLNKILLSKVNQSFETRFGDSLIHKPNGNIILISVNSKYQIELTEIDARGRIVRQHKPPLSGGSGVNFADAYGRVIITHTYNGVEVLDSEFNLLKVTVAPMSGRVQFKVPHIMHYNRQRDEVVGIYANSTTTSTLSIFRFKEE